MRILILSDVFFPDIIGGAGKYAYYVAKGLVDKGHEVDVITRRLNGLSAEEIIDGIRVFRAGWFGRPDLLKPFLFIKEVNKIFKAISLKNNFDLIVFNQPLSALSVILSNKAKGIPKIYNFQSSWAEEFEIKSFLKHSPHMPYVMLKRAFLFPVLFLMRKIERAVICKSDRVSTLSQYVKNRLQGLYGIPKGIISVFPPGVDTDKLKPISNQEKDSLRLELGMDKRSFILFTARNLVPRMGLDNLIIAFSILSREKANIKLIIAGGGFLDERLKKLANRLNLDDKIEFLGRVSEGILIKYYQLADLFILPTQFLEGFGIATIEALACGLPVLGTPVGGTIEILGKLDKNLIFSGVDSESMAGKILEFMKDAQDKGILSNRCRQFILENYSLDRFFEEIEKFYLSVAKKDSASIRKQAAIKVLHIHTRAIVGGSGTNTLLTMAGLPKDRFYPVLACGSEGPLVDEAIKKGLVVEILPHLKNRINIFGDFMALLEIMKLIKKEKFTIVHTHNSKAGILGRLAARLLRVPIVIHTVHSCVFKYPTLNWFQRKLFLWLEKFATKSTDKLITISEPLKEEFVKARIDKPDKFITIYSGIEIDRFNQGINLQKRKQELDIPEDCFVVGIIARLEKGKGHEFVMRAIPLILREIKNIIFVFVGDGPLRNNLETLATQLKVKEKIVFTGSREDVSEILQVFDISCLASLYEGMGRVILEAQAAGKPVVATRVGGIPDIVSENKTALLVKPKDSTALAEAIIKLIKGGRLRAAMSKSAKEFVGFKFSAERMVSDIIKVYEELLAEKLKW